MLIAYSEAFDVVGDAVDKMVVDRSKVVIVGVATGYSENNIEEFSGTERLIDVAEVA